MIRYYISDQELQKRITDVKSDWLARAKERTKKLRQLKKYKDVGSIWSEIKEVYMTLQNCKCVYCESQLPAIKYGKVSHDVEHYRPKASIKPWPKQEVLERLGVDFTKTPKKKKGYYLLPFNIFNYATSCKVCNSILKKDYFPISGNYKLNVGDPRKLTSEQAYLLYPIGDLDVNPEDVITFVGLTPAPKSQVNGHLKNRALVTIEFFSLADGDGRSDLYSERAKIVIALYLLLKETVRGSQNERGDAMSKLDSFLQPSLAHYSCAKNFKILFENDPSSAKAIYDAAFKYVNTVS